MVVSMRQLTPTRARLFGTHNQQPNRCPSLSNLMTEYFSRTAELRTQWDRVTGKVSPRPMDPVLITVTVLDCTGYLILPVSNS